MSSSRRFLAVLAIACVLVPAMVFAGGAGDRVTATRGSAANPAGTVPITDERVQVSAFMVLGQRADNYDYGTNLFSTWYTDTTNVEFRFTTAPATDAKTRLNLLLNTGDYPDVIFKQLSLAELSMYGAEGVLVPLDSYVEEYGSWINNVFEEYPIARQLVTGSDGRMYAIPGVNDCYHCRHNGRLWVYNPWFQQLKSTYGIDIPTTTEEFREYLRLIRDTDLNGNGRQDEIPLAGRVDGMGRLDWYFMNAFVLYPAQSHTHRLTVDDNGRLVASYMEPGYKAGLEYLHSLYAEGLIMPESFSVTREEIRRIGENPEAVAIGTAPGHGPEDFVRKAGRAGRWEQYITIPPLQGPDGLRYAMYHGSQQAVYPGFFVTDQADDPAVAFRAGEYFLSGPETTLRGYIGPRGVAWDWADAGATGIHGEPALYKLLIPFGTQPMNSSWDQANHDFRSEYFRLSEQAPNSRRVMEYLDTRNPALAGEMFDYPDYNEVMKYYLSYRDYHPYVYDESHIVPPMVYDSTVFTEIADIEAVLLPYVDEMLARFVTGDVDIESGWPTYLRELRNMRVDRYLELQQQTFNAMRAR